jgi:hypothetical protein
MTFEEWLRDLDYPDNDPLNIAECAWNAAITEAAKIVELNHDPGEPWLYPYEILFLKSNNPNNNGKCE